MEIQPIRITDKSEDKFDLEEYCDILLQALEEGFAFQTFSDYLDNPQRKVILLRHDIDVSLEYGMQMARIEQHLGITSTFFVRLHSYFYNLLEEENMKRLAELAEMNFEVGIHQEIYKFTADRQELIDILKIEKKLVEAIIGKQILGVATHVPKKNVIKMTPDFLPKPVFAIAQAVRFLIKMPFLFLIPTKNGSGIPSGRPWQSRTRSWRISIRCGGPGSSRIIPV